MNLLEDLNNPLWKSINVIYCYTNKLNNKKYVGQTKSTLKNRHRQHMYEVNNDGHGHDYHLHNAIRKYGIENFSLEILHFCDEYSINLLEIYYIDKFNLTNRNYGYNSAYGGDYSLYTDERNQKISDSLKGRTFSEEHKQKLSEIAKERLKDKTKHPMYNKHHNEESRKKIKEHHADFKGENHPQFGKMGKENKNSKKVAQYDLNMNLIKIWDCIKDVEREIGIHATCISACCRGKRKTAVKYIWKYVD